MFDTYFEDVNERGAGSYPSNQILDFVASELGTWGRNGITLTRDDIKAAISGSLWVGSNEGSGLCQNKTDGNGDPIVFDTGAGNASCIGLQTAILSLVTQEKTAEDLGDTLLMAANGAELAVADEPHRPIKIGALSLLLKRVWSGTGTGILPWNTAANADLDALDAELSGLSPDDLDAVIFRFHFGYFRDQRESDPRFTGIGTSVETKLLNLATTLGVIDDPELIGEFATPNLKQTKNVAFWARRNDVGLQWVYPTHMTRLALEKADEYPAMIPAPTGSVLAYPFEYEGTASLTDPLLRSPLCSRTVGRQGYLCRRQSVNPSECPNPDPENIALVECSEDSVETEQGPDICRDIDNLYVNDGTPLADPDDTNHLNPALKPAPVNVICSPERNVLYQDSVSAHACFVGHCLAESMSGHTLVPNRNVTLMNEGTSPFLACMRADPQLGLYAEAAHKSSLSIPPYMGHLLVQDFEREYCLKNGDSPRPVLGDCAFNTETIARSPSYEGASVTDTILRNATEVATSQQEFLSLALPIGQRAALDQSLAVDRKLFAVMAGFVRQMSDLLLELKRAPITKTACPWTGPFQQFAP